MTELLNNIETSELSKRLKEYFKGSKRIQKILTAELIEDIEDLFLLYQSQYDFQTAMFDGYVIDSLKRCKDFSTYYFYLKKILENHLEVELKNENNIVRLNKTIITKEFRKTASEIINLLPSQSEGIFNHIHFLLGKLDLFHQLIEDDNITQLYENITQLVGNYSAPLVE